MLNILKQLSEQIVAPDVFIRKRYAAFQDLLDNDRKCHSLLAELEDIYYSDRQVDINRIRTLYQQFSAAVAEMISCLARLAPDQHKNLIDYFKKFDFYIRFALAPPKLDVAPPYILPLDAHYPDDHITGGKGLHLSQLCHDLKLPIPSGFVISTAAWQGIVAENNLRPQINRLLAEIDITSLSSLQEISQKVRQLLEKAEIPAGAADEIDTAVIRLAGEYPGSLFAVRSSAIGEDSSLSFAGQYRSVLEVGKEDIRDAYKTVLLSKYSPSALLYRIINGLDDEATPMAVIVLAMVDARMSGVVTSANPCEADDGTILIHSVAGLGENLMGGMMVPVTHEIGENDGATYIKRCTPHKEEIELEDSQLHLLANWSKKISDYYGCPQEIEWSLDHQGTIYLLQARALHVEPLKEEVSVPQTAGLSLLFEGGINASPGICSGTAFHLPNAIEIDLALPERTILICDVTPPSLVTLLPRLAGVIARQGSVADHFASVAREFHIPFLVQTGDSCMKIGDGEKITLLAESRSVFQGEIEIEGNFPQQGDDTSKTPLYRALKMVIDFTSPLALVDPGSQEFNPENCRSLHDIIRFAHEKAVQSMFIRSAQGFLRKPKGVLLKTALPLQMHIVDVGGGIDPASVGKKEITVSDLVCLPLQTLWRGLSHPNIHWRGHTHYDWKGYDSIALAGGISVKDSAALASFALISSEYLNVNIRFGYHFTLLDCLCGETPEENYIMLRFVGGGGSSLGKDLRLSFIARVLRRLNFQCEHTGELLDGRLMRYSKDDTALRLDQVGRLLGSVRLLDMVLKDEDEIEGMVENFIHGKYDFSHHE